MKPMLRAALATAAVALSVPASAQFAKAEDAIKYRQSAFTVLAQHFGTLGAMANGKIAHDADQARADAEVVALAATLPWHAFGEGTDKGRETGARPEIWKEQDKFKQRAEDMQTAVLGKLVPAAKSGDLEQLKATFGPAAQSCKACHDDFRRRR